MCRTQRLHYLVVHHTGEITMAKRQIYVPNLKGRKLVAPIEIEFNWVAGLSVSQKQKNIRSLHSAAAAQRNLNRLLEISSKSEHQLGVALSAFNLTLTLSNGQSHTIETVFQSSKVFERGGPYIDLLEESSAAAKGDDRLRESGKLIGFRLEGKDWPVMPTTVFYDWLYLKALSQHPELAERLVEYDGFTDIEFNPARSLNCQAASAALYVSLQKHNELESSLKSSERFLARMEQTFFL